MTQLLGSKWLNFISWCTELKNWVILTLKVGSNFKSTSDSIFLVKMTQFFLSMHCERKIESFWPKKVGSNFGSASDSTFKVKMTQFFLSMHWEKKMSHIDLKSWVTCCWAETKTFELKKKKTFIVLVTQRVTDSLVLLLKLLISKIHQNNCYINYILKWFWKWF